VTANLWCIKTKKGSPYFASDSDVLKLAERESQQMGSPPFRGTSVEQAIEYLKHFDTKVEKY
jgi:hypothetical protein